MGEQVLVESHDNLGNPEQKKASRIVIYDNFGNPIACFLQITSTIIDGRFQGQPGFDEALKYLGINKTVVTNLVQAKPNLLPISNAGAAAW